MNEREWLLGDESVDELHEYKNLGVVKTIRAPSPLMFKITLINTKKGRNDIFS